MGIVARLMMPVMALLFAAPASAAWLEAESPHFLVYSDGKEQELRSNVRLLEDFHELLADLTGVDDPSSPSKLRIYLASSSKELRKVRNVGGGMGGFYLATSEGVAAFAIRKDYGLGWAADTLFHEYAHHFMLQHFPANYPTWYIEGFAEYLATVEFTDTHVDVGRDNRIRATWLRANWYSLDNMLTRDSASAGGSLFYAQSWLMVHYLMRDPERRALLQRYLRGFAEGEDPKASFRTVFEMDAVDFTRILRGYGNDMTFTRIPRASRADPVAISVRRLPPSEDDLLLYSAGLSLGLADWGSYPVLPRVRDAVEDHPDDPAAMEALIRAELLYGDRARAEALLDRLLKLRPDDRDALYLRGLAHIHAGRADSAARAEHFAKARPWLARAHKADENFYPALIRYAESFSADPAFAGENVGNILLLAAQLAPQVSLIRLNAAHQQALHGDFEMAKALLAPVVNEPHSTRLREAARTLMAEVEAGKAPPAVFHIERIEDD
ncbi:hypothetical protein ACFQRC_10830 [Enterovirga sp. GCM10030262]|uniref:hypothetical protein n=1 Tax=Enterovirga sp. GCM10030262 TaxID=3273391 RepID=UPI00361DF630